MRRQRTRMLVVSLLAAVAFPLAARAQEGLNGSYTLNAAQSDDINRAIETAVARMNFITRPIARGRLRKTNPRYNRLVLSHNAQQVAVTFDQRRPVESPANGQVIKWTREDGEKFDLSTTWQGNDLVQTFQAEDGRRVNNYTLSPDGRTLTMNVTITSPRLPQPLRYKLVYNRAS